MWNFVGGKREVWWVWAALDAATWQVVAMAAGDRSEFTVRCFWEALPDGHASGALACSDFRATYAAVIPESQHVACGKEAGKTCHVERF